MTPEERKQAIADLAVRIAELKRQLKGFAARMQEVTTTLYAAHADDWEVRYVEQGTADLEALANGEDTTNT